MLNIYSNTLMRSWNLQHEYLAFVMLMNDPLGLISRNMRKI